MRNSFTSSSWSVFICFFHWQTPTKWWWILILSRVMIVQMTWTRVATVDCAWEARLIVGYRPLASLLNQESMDHTSETRSHASDTEKILNHRSEGSFGLDRCRALLHWLDFQYWLSSTWSFTISISTRSIVDSMCIYGLSTALSSCLRSSSSSMTIVGASSIYFACCTFPLYILSCFFKYSINWSNQFIICSKCMYISVANSPTDWANVPQECITGL